MSSFVLQQEFSFQASQEELSNILDYIATKQVNISSLVVTRLCNRDHVKIIPGLPFRVTDQYSIQVVRDALTFEKIIFYQNTVIVVSPNAILIDRPLADQSPSGKLRYIVNILNPTVTIFSLNYNEGGYLVLATSNNELTLRLLGLWY